MSFFSSLNFSKRRDNKENILTPLSSFSVKSDSSVAQREDILKTPTERSLFYNKVNDSAKSQLSFDLMSNKTKMSDNKQLTIDSTIEQITEDTKNLKSSVAEELERIETFRVISKMTIERQTEEIEKLKSDKEEVENRLTQSRREVSDLRVKLNVETAEKEEVLLKMNNTRDMLIKVKDYVQLIETRLETLEEVNEAMEMVNEERCQQFNELNQRFLKLDLKHKHIVSELMSESVGKDSEIEILNQNIDKIKNDFEVNKNDCIQKINKLKEENQSIESALNEANLKINELLANNHSLESALNESNLKIIELSENNKSLELTLEEANIRIKELTQNLTQFEERHVSDVITAEQKDNEFEKQCTDFQNQIKDLNNNIDNYIEKEKAFIEATDELKAEIISKDETISGFKLEIEKREQLVTDLENEIKIKEQKIIEISSEKSNLNENNEELNSKILSIETERKDFETSVLIEKQSIICEFEKTIKDFNSKIITLSEEKNELIKCKEENEILIEDLESKANQSVIEKESIEQKLKNELKELRDEFNKRIDELSAKITDYENKVKDLNAMKDQNETTINEILSEAETLRAEKEELKQKLQKEERSLENQISNMSTILESCKSDYNKRIEDKEERIKEYKRENERMRINIDQLTKKTEKLENEKQSINRKLQELTISALRSSGSPNRVLTPKFMSPIESTRISSQNRTSSPFIKPLDFNTNDSFVKTFDEDLLLPAKHEFQEKIKPQSSEKVAPVLQQKGMESKSKKVSKPPALKQTQRKKIVRLDDSNSSESVYEFIDKNIKKINKGIRKPTDGDRHRIDTSLKVSMKGVKDDDNTQEYDTEKEMEPFNKKLKTNLKTYGKNTRAENIIKGRPTPTRTDDLSWIF